MDKDDIIRIAKSKGLTNKEFIEKDYYIDLILYEVSKLNLNIIFKGGTALYKIYGIPRFSEDLDFTLLEMDAKKIITGMEHIAKKHNFKSYPKTTKTSVYVKFKFKGFLTTENVIKLEFNTFHKPLYYSLKSYISEYIDIPPFMINVLDKKEILAEKIHAIYHRNSARDLYNLFYLLRTEKPESELIKKKVPEFKCRQFIDLLGKYKQLWDTEIKTFALEYVDFDTVYSYVKGKMGNCA